MAVLDTGILLVGVVNLIGVGFLMKWVRVLKGTVAAQEITVRTVTSLNTTMLEIVKALDPERWAKEIQVHKQLADQKAAAFVEIEREKLEAERRRDTTKLTAFAVAQTLTHYRLVLRLLSYVPRQERANLIGDTLGLRDEDKLLLLQTAEELPDLSFGGRLAGSFEALAAAFRATHPVA